MVLGRHVFNICHYISHIFHTRDDIFHSIFEIRPWINLHFLLTRLLPHRSTIPAKKNRPSRKNSVSHRNKLSHCYNQRAHPKLYTLGHNIDLSNLQPNNADDNFFHHCGLPKIQSTIRKVSCFSWELHQRGPIMFNEGIKEKYLLKFMRGREKH